MKKILNSAEHMLGLEDYENVKAIYDHYYLNNPNGKAFPIRNWANIDTMEHVLKLDTNNWHGWIDLTNPLELLNFKKYVYRK